MSPAQARSAMTSGEPSEKWWARRSNNPTIRHVELPPRPQPPDPVALVAEPRDVVGGEHQLGGRPQGPKKSRDGLLGLGRLGATSLERSKQRWATPCQ